MKSKLLNSLNWIKQENESFTMFTYIMPTINVQNLLPYDKLLMIAFKKLEKAETCLLLLIFYAGFVLFYCLRFFLILVKRKRTKRKIEKKNRFVIKFDL